MSKGGASTRFRIWWRPQVPCPAFYIYLETDQVITAVSQAKLLLRSLAQYDIFQYENKIKSDYCNAGGFEVFEAGEWVEWFNSNGDDVHEAEFNAKVTLHGKDKRGSG